MRASVAIAVAILLTSKPVISDAAAGEEAGQRLEEVVVTAQKREERLQDVPIPVTTVTAETLLDRNQVRVQDYQLEVPGLRVTPTTGFGQILAIRGITTGGAGSIPTVGITLDDVPLGSSTSVGLGLVIPDLDPSDLSRIEFLRGPQGTLYGASSMGGLLKYVSRDPSTEKFSGRIEAGTTSARNGSDLGYQLRGSLDGPLSDSIAFGISGFTRRDPGYIDNPVYGLEGVNEREVSGGRLSVLWRTSDAFSLKLAALYQDFDSAGTNGVEDGFGDLEQGWLPGSGRSHGATEIYSAVANLKIGKVDVVSVTGYNIRDAKDGIDFSDVWSDLAQDTFGVAGVNLVTEGKTKKFTQELRVTAPLGDHVELLLGGFYADEDSTYVQDSQGVDSTTGEEVGSGYFSTSPTRYREQSLFADLTFLVSDQFDVQVGGRWSDIKQRGLAGVFTAPFFGVPDLITGTESAGESSPSSYLLTPRYKFSDDLMIYARLASGYRSGGINGDANDPSPTGCAALGIPCVFSPDKTHTYEAGVKGAFFDHRVSLDASVYRIDWKDVQVFVVDSGFGFNTNGGKVRSQGVELSSDIQPAAGSRIMLWGAWNDAELVDDLPEGSTAYGLNGFRLPYAARFAGTLSFDQEFQLGSLAAFVGGSVSYVGNRPGLFTGGPADSRINLPSYSQTDLRAGATLGSWRVNLSLNNLFDKRGILDSGADITPAGFLYIQPRTFGLSVARSFGSADR